jgi:phosphate transport system substrate-binding protein
MFHEFGADARLPLTAAFSLSAVVAAMVSVVPSAQAQACVPSATGIPSAACQQLFAGGATFPLLLNRQYHDYFGIAIPTGAPIAPGQPGATGVQPINPAGSPRNINVQVNYCGTGSGNGRAIFTGVPATSATSASCSYATASTIDGSGVSVGTAFAPFPTNTPGVTPVFAGTDTPLSATNINDYTAQKLATRGNPIQVPTVFGAIDLINNPALGSLNITTAQLCRIFDGSITTIDGTDTGAPITVVVRSDNSGTTTAFTTYLAAACPGVSGGSYYITTGVGVFPTTNPGNVVFNTQNGNDGVAGRVAAVANAVGYTEASFGSPYATTALDPVTGTTNPAPLLANLQNPSAITQTFVFPTPTTINRRLTGISLTANTTYPCILAVAGLPVLPAPANTTTTSQAFPIVSPTYALHYTRYATTEQAAATRSLFNFILGNRPARFPAANDQIAEGLGFSVLSNGTFNPNTATNLLRGSARACVATVTFPLLP